MCVMYVLCAGFSCHKYIPLAASSSELSCHSLVLLCQLLMIVMMILVMVLKMKIFLPVNSQLSKCCGEEEIFYQDTMECGPDKVGTEREIISAHAKGVLAHFSINL
jgi:hypothetical protein